MYEPSGAGWRVVEAREKLSSMRWMEVRNALDAVRPWERACWRKPVGVLLAWSDIVGMESGRSHCMKTETATIRPRRSLLWRWF